MTHHPQAYTLISYVAGTLPNSIACVVACHLDLCKECSAHARRLGIVGGLMLRKLEAAPPDTAFGAAASMHWSAETLPPREGRQCGRAPDDVRDPWLPSPLADYLAMSGDEIPWKRVVKGVQQYWVKLPEGAGQIRLLRLAPGKLLLEHTHTGMELTLVLQGVYGDHSGDYLRGDVIEWSEGTLHQPRAGGDVECICVIASEQTPYFTRLAARLLRPIMGF